MKKILEKILCRWFGIHKVDEDEWKDSFGWGEEYLGQTNWCSRCGEMIKRDEQNF
jgi:hypothetical protein